MVCSWSRGGQYGVERALLSSPGGRRENGCATRNDRTGPCVACKTCRRFRDAGTDLYQRSYRLIRDFFLLTLFDRVEHLAGRNQLFHFLDVRPIRILNA